MRGTTETQRRLDVSEKIATAVRPKQTESDVMSIVYTNLRTRRQCGGLSYKIVAQRAIRTSGHGAECDLLELALCSLQSAAIECDPIYGETGRTVDPWLPFRNNAVVGGPAPNTSLNLRFTSALLPPSALGIFLSKLLIFANINSRKHIL